jgi:lactate permease
MWCLPAIVVAALIGSGRVGVMGAAIIGVAVACVDSIWTSPQSFGLVDAAVSLTRGAWIGWTIAPYILGGLLFWHVVMENRAAAIASTSEHQSAPSRRRLLFVACFLVGPFVEAATGFGVGIVGTMAIIRPLGIAPKYLAAFGLMSQTMIPWGAMGSGSMAGAAFANADPTALVLHSSILIVAFNALWLPIFWRLARKAGLSANWQEQLSEAAWLGGALACLIGATALIGPEAAMLVAYGPLILLRYVIDWQPDRAAFRAARDRVVPFTILLIWLMAIKLIPSLHGFLESLGQIAPFPRAPIWTPFLHAGTWLVVAAVVTSLLKPTGKSLFSEFALAWGTGRLALTSVALFAMMAELLANSGIAGSMAGAAFDTMGRGALMLTPFLSGGFGLLANSGNAPNSLFMASQIALATNAGLNVAAVTALQHVAGTSMSMFSPVRMSITCKLAEVPGTERDTFRIMLPFAAAAMSVLIASAFLIIAL